MYKHLFVLLFLCTLTAFGADSTEHWIEVQTPHFIVLTDSNGKQALRLATQFEQMRSVFHTFFPNASDGSSPIVVVAVKDKKGFQALEPEAYLAKGQLNLAGLFMSGADENYIMLRLDTETEHPFAVVYHEYTHFMTRKATWMPLWMSEGLAEFYQNTDIYDKEVLLGQPSVDDILYLQQNRLLPLTTLLTVDHASPYYHDEQKGSVFYAESWTLTHYLEMTDHEKNTSRLQDYAKLVSQNVDPVTAAQKAFGDLKQLEGSLNAYVRSSNFKMFKMSTGVTVDASSFQQKAVSQAEADVIRAGVLIQNNRLTDAQRLLDASLREDPNNASAHASMGLLKVREGDMAGARKWYGEAIQLDPQDWLANFYYARVSLQSGGEDDAAIEASLRAAIKLNPKFAPSYDTLAMFCAERGKDLEEAHRLNAMAIELEPENLAYRINAASVLSQQRQYHSAISVLEFAKKVTKTSADITLVDNRIHQLEQFEAAADKAKAQANATVERPDVTPGTTMPSDPTKTLVFRRVDGTMVGRIEERPHYPEGEAKGPHHKIQGILRDVRCSDRTVIALNVDLGKRTVPLYSNNYFKITFTAGNFTPDSEVKPCTGIEGMKALVDYAEVTDKAVAGQIVSIELSK